jgi:hypothetical protein
MSRSAEVGELFLADPPLRRLEASKVVVATAASFELTQH